MPSVHRARLKNAANSVKVVQDVIVELRSEDSARQGPSSKTAKPQCVYVGWTGMASTSTKGATGKFASNRRGDVALIELDATFSRMLGLFDGQKVSLDGSSFSFPG